MRIEKALIDRNTLQNLIFNMISNHTYKKYTDNMCTSNRPEFEAGFIQGLCWAGLLSAQLETIYLKGDK